MFIALTGPLQMIFAVSRQLNKYHFDLIQQTLTLSLSLAHSLIDIFSNYRTRLISCLHSLSSIYIYFFFAHNNCWEFKSSSEFLFILISWWFREREKQKQIADTHLYCKMHCVSRCAAADVICIDHPPCTTTKM
jgi:hypothetical protein